MFPQITCEMVQHMWTYAVQHRIVGLKENDVQFEPQLAHITAVRLSMLSS